MFKITCPRCANVAKQLTAKPVKGKFKWYEFTRYATFCPHCGTELALEKSFQRWALLLIPMLVVLIIKATGIVEHGSIFKAVEYGSWLLGGVGVLMTIIKRKYVAVEKAPSNPRFERDAP